MRVTQRSDRQRRRSRRVPALHGQNETGGLAQPAFEHTRQPGPQFGSSSFELERIEIDGKRALRADVVPRVFIGRHRMIGMDVEPPRNAGDEVSRILQRRRIIVPFAGNAFGIGHSGRPSPRQ